MALSLMNVGLQQRQAAIDPQTKPTDFGHEFACIRRYCLQPPSLFITVTQP